MSEEDLHYNKITDVNQLENYLKIHYTKIIKATIGEHYNELFCLERTYIKNCDYLLSFKENKNLSDIFEYINSDDIEFHYFIVGGASIHCERNYKFIIHPNEDIHKYSPHVHVEKERKSIRYNLETLEPMDKLDYPHKRDHKKIIIPALKKHKNELMEFWNHYQNGYTPPILSDDGRQYYAES